MFLKSTLEDPVEPHGIQSVTQKLTVMEQMMAFGSSRSFYYPVCNT